MKTKLVDAVIVAFWFLMIILFPIGSVFVSGMYGMPWVLNKANCIPRSNEEKIIELVVLFGSMSIGFFVMLIIARLVFQFVLSVDTRERWETMFSDQNKSTDRVKLFFHSCLRWSIVGGRSD